MKETLTILIFFISLYFFSKLSINKEYKKDKKKLLKNLTGKVRYTRTSKGLIISVEEKKGTSKQWRIATPEEIKNLKNLRIIK